MRVETRVNDRILKMRKLLALTPRDMKAMTRQIDVEFTRHERKLFASEGRLGGQAWAPLSPRYRRYKRRVRPGRKKLVFDGDLRKSLVGRTHPLHVSRWALKPRAVITVGTADVKAAYHGPKARNPLANPLVPVRDALAHTARQLGRYTELIREYFVKVKMERFLRAARQIGAMKRIR